MLESWLSLETLWGNALIVIPVVMLAIILTRWLRCRPSTRHTLWLIALLSLVMPTGMGDVSRGLLGMVRDVTAGPADAAVDHGRQALNLGRVMISKLGQRAGPETSRDVLVAAPTPPLEAPAPTPEPVPAPEPDPCGGCSVEEGRTLDIAAPLPSVVTLSPDDPWGVCDVDDVVRSDRPAVSPAVPSATTRASVTPSPAAVFQPPAVHFEAHGICIVDDPEPPVVAVAAEPVRPTRVDRPELVEPASAGAPPLPSTAGPAALSVPSIAPGFAAAAVAEWREWLAHLRGLRDELVGMPPIPSTLWAIGAVAMVGAVVLSVHRHRRLVRHAEPAGEDVCRMVRECADELGVRREPATLMVRAAISPMLSLGARTKLILPIGLWEALDEEGRRTILLHEMAHLRRRDHWLRWAELIIGAVYWWHPLVWLIRRRLHEEADLCCDVWVTTVRPRGRRAYAQALLETRKYIGSTRPIVPAVGLGATTVGAKRFARRLTMVMTEHGTPRMTVRGVALSLVLAVTGCLVTPILACPPEDKPAPKPVKKEKTARHKKDHATFEIHVAHPTAPEPATAPTPMTTFEQHMRDRERAGDDHHADSLEERMRHLEDQLRRLQERLHDSVAPKAKDAADKARGLYMEAMKNLRPEPPAAPGQLIVRVYHLPEGKLADLTGLMVRDDVPILVRPLDDGIEVHATEPHHRIFRQFVTMINADDRREKYTLPEGKLDALTKLMARDDVPVLISPGDEAITVHGDDLVQSVFEEFVRMIHPGEKAMVRGYTDAPPAPGWTRMPEDYARVAPRLQELRDMNRQLRPQLDAARRQVETQMKKLRKEAEHLWRKSEELHEQSERIHDESEAMHESAEDLTDEARHEALRHAEKLHVKSEELHDRAEATESRAEAVEAQVEAMMAHLEQLTVQINEQMERAFDGMNFDFDVADPDVDMDVDMDFDFETPEPDVEVETVR